LTELTGPRYGHRAVTAEDADLTRQHAGEPLGQRIIVHGRLLDDAGRPVRGQLVEVWQANACGRYAHPADRTPLPLDPNFTGAGRTVTDDDGWYRFVTIKPAPYPWGNHPNAWRPAHIHFSVFGPCFSSRLVTQMYFPDDPLFAHDPIFLSVPEAARPRLVSRLDLGASIPEHALAFRFDVVVRGPAATPVEA
jgi:protocatechuate 3,4-dioxygenase beta subunit